MQDRIEREITIRAPRERVFNAIIDPQKIVAWFPETVEGEFKEGEQPVFGFGEYGRHSVYVVKIQPVDYVAYRWVPSLDATSGVVDVLSQPNTLVEFHLTVDGATTIVKLTETGFDGLPADIGKKMVTENASGWEHMFGRLKKLLEK
jgi:uncharacterized protein YndB with AHSA1/START domain